MKPIFRIISYFFKKRNISFTDQNIHSFFENGVSFPKFVALSLNVDEIPQIIGNPEMSNQKEHNNKIALQFLFQKCPEIAKKSPSFITDQNKANLLELILTNICFNIDLSEILNKCNKILQPAGITLNNIDELMNKKILITLLCLLSSNESNYESETNDFDQLIFNYFQFAEVPLVIDESTLNTKNRNIFLIQILIIFDIYSEKISHLQINEEVLQNTQKIVDHFKELSTNKIFSTIENCKDVDDSYSQSDSYEDQKSDNESIENISNGLLKVLNSIGKSGNLKFDNFQTKKNIIKFVDMIMKDEISEITSQEEPFNIAIKKVIKFLSSKDPIFDILLFNFNDPKLVVSSSISFYTNFLNIFFLTKSREELTERCSTIIFGNLNRNDIFYPSFQANIKKDPYQMENLLSKKDTYDALVYFLNKRSTHFTMNEQKNISKYYNNSHINELNENDLTNPEIRFYQLQIIFNKLDDKNFVYYLHELFLIAIRKIRRIKIMKLKYITQSIITKNKSLEMQKKRYISFLNKNIPSTTEDQDDLNFESKEQSDQPETFNQSSLEQSLKLEEAFSLTEHSAIEYQTPENYWNSIDDKYSFDHGILFRKHSKQDVWINNIKNYIRNAVPNASNQTKTNLFFSLPKKNMKFKLYKLFIYNEKVEKWEENSKGIAELVEDKFYKLNPELSYVLFLNSFENDLITLNSNLSSFNLPDLDDDNIYIYALLDKPMSLLDYEIISLSLEKNVKPLFLLLHVPNREIKNIKSIIFKIYHFLSTICDVEIVILNKKYYNDQIDMIKKLNNLKRSYLNGIELITKAKKSSTNKIDMLDSIIETNKNKDFSSDGDGFNDNFEDEESSDHFYDLFNLSVFEKKHELILLFNDDCVQCDIQQNLEENTFFDSFKKSLGVPYYACCININMPVTYRCFLMCLNEAVSKNNSSFEDSFHYFNFIQISDLTNLYINVKSCNKWKSKLKKLIYDRFLQLKRNNLEGLNELLLVDQLNKELMKIRPSIDIDFIKKCNSVLVKIRKEIIKKNKSIFEQELEKSSRNNIEYLTAIIKKADFISNDKKKSMKDSHELFLRNKFFDITKALYPKDAIVHVLNTNSSLLANQIRNDSEILEDIFSKFSVNSNKKVVNLIDSVKDGTNYTIRETENTKETEVIVEAGNLESVFEQDF